MPNHRLIHAATCVVVIASSISSSAWAQDAPDTTFVDIDGGFTPIDLSTDGISEADRDFIAGEVVDHLNASGALSFDSSVEPSVLYSFFPMSIIGKRSWVFGNVRQHAFR